MACDTADESIFSLSPSRASGRVSWSPLRRKYEVLSFSGSESAPQLPLWTDAQAALVRGRLQAAACLQHGGTPAPTPDYYSPSLVGEHLVPPPAPSALSSKLVGDVHGAAAPPAAAQVYRALTHLAGNFEGELSSPSEAFHPSFGNPLSVDVPLGWRGRGSASSCFDSPARRSPPSPASPSAPLRACLEGRDTARALAAAQRLPPEIVADALQELFPHLTHRYLRMHWEGLINGMVKAPAAPPPPPHRYLSSAELHTKARPHRTFTRNVDML